MTEASLSALFLSNPELAIALRRQMEGRAQSKEGSSSDPIRSVWQGVNRVAQGLLGGYEQRKGEEEAKAIGEKDDAEVSSYSADIAKLLAARQGGAAAPEAPGMGAALMGQPAAPPQGAPAAPAANSQDFVRQYAPHAMAASHATGLDPRLILAQAGLESGWGKSAPGNNFFGIKGPGQSLPTQEFVNGQMTPQQASFRTYGSPGESFQGYADFLKTNPRYAPVLGAQGMENQIAAMGKSGYATDPNYEQKLRAIAQGIQLPPGAPEQGNAPMGAAPGPGNALPPQQGAIGGAPSPQPMAQSAPPVPPPMPPGGASPMPPPGTPQPGPMGGQQSALMDIYMRGMRSRNPQMQRMAAGMAPFLKMEDEIKVLAPGAQAFDRAGNLRFQNTNDPTANRININNETKGPNAFETDRGKALAERVGEWDAAWEKGHGTLNNITAFREVMKGIQTGAGSQTLITMGQVGQRLGLSPEALSAIGLDPKATANLETVRSLGAAFLRDQIGKGGFPAQNFSDADRRMLERANAGLDNSPEANAMILSLAEAAARRQTEIGREWRNWTRQHGEDLDSSRRFQRERLPQIVEKDIITPLFANRPPPGPQAPAGPAPGGAVGGAAAPSAAAPRIAVNPQTGQKVIFQDGKWVPMQ